MKTKDFVAADLIKKLQTLEGLTNDERSNLIGLLRQHKKYGLVWEDKPEDVEERLRESLPVLREVKDKAILSDEPDAPNHILIEAENLQALVVLTYTHAGMIDVIYIDPPYNTGNKDFVYNDSFVDTDDSYRHSKWLSFMSKRLKIAKALLSDKGVIFISIDDNELANLKLLCDEVFGNSAFVACTARRRRKSQANLSKNISTIHEYVLIYKKSEEHELKKVEANIDLADYKNPDNDPRGAYKTMPCTNRGGTKYSVKTPTGRIIQEEWRFKEETYYSLLKDNRIVFPKGGEGKPRYKIFLSEKEKGGVIDNSWWDDLGSNQEGAMLLEEIVGKDLFNNPKPVGLLNHILKLNSVDDSTILDFFAGSGTTLHATMQLNAEDGGHRQCILVTNNENNICEEVTYERNKRVIQGYTTPKGVKVEGLKQNTLRYYKTDFISRDRTQKNMRALVAAATDLLCIKEDLYEERATLGRLKLKPHLARYFNDGRKHMMIIYREELIDEVVEEIKRSLTPKPLSEERGVERLKIYVFSPGRYAFTDNFREVEDKVELVALPAAIYDAYQKVLPKRKEKLFEEEKPEIKIPTDLFEGQGE
ncbi:MAG: site-specific DNA-methyltransferase [Bacteroidaceae bacterium]|nr:site-specific DNA-methyltransferase [Bacteroidaceae bacterium]